MLDNFFEQNAWCYWVISVAALLSFVGFIVACICSCRHNENKSEFLGLAGMVTMTRAENEVFDNQPTSDYSQCVTLDAVDGGKRANSANRSLPDIPKDRNACAGESGLESTTQDIIYEAAEIIGDPSELYATVQDKNVTKRSNERVTRTSSQESSSLQEDDGAYPYARLNPVKTTSDEHPYAQVQNIPKVETNRQNSFRTNPSQIPAANLPSSSNQQTNPVAPPRTRRSLSQNSLLNVEAPTCDIQAANAISGGVQANQDLPYMTPPLLLSLPRVPGNMSQAQPHSHSQSQPHEHPNNGQQQHFSGDSQDSKGYTSISVREPLANIIAQTKAQNRQQPHRPSMDSHYATVSDDSDEMYAAIDEQEKIYTSGSETYAQIQPMNTEISRMTHTESQPPINHPIHPLPSRLEDIIFSAPQPPSVDSLRHVAHAHSRQASSSSATSSIANPGSPKPEKRQANSPLPPPPPPLPPSDVDSSDNPQVNTDVYALIDKHSKPDDSTGLSVGKSLEDMYAKVMKKKRDSEEDVVPVNFTDSSGKKLSLVEVPRASWSGRDSVEIQKRESDVNRTSSVSPDVLNINIDSIEFAKVSRIYELDRTPELEHNFETVSSQRTQRSQATRLRSDVGDIDPDYEMLKPQNSSSSTSSSSLRPDEVKSSTRNGIDVLPFYSVPFKHRQISNASSEDPGYEKVRLRRRADPDADTDSEPNYESMPHEPNYASVCRPGDSDTDPNYESVNNSDPNYESVRYMSMPSTNSINQVNQGNQDPPYEQVNVYKNNKHTDGYEKVKCKTSDDPNYEKIQTSASTNENADTDDEQYVQV